MIANGLDAEPITIPGFEVISGLFGSFETPISTLVDTYAETMTINQGRRENRPKHHLVGKLESLEDRVHLLPKQAENDSFVLSIFNQTRADRDTRDLMTYICSYLNANPQEFEGLMPVSVGLHRRNDYGVQKFCSELYLFADVPVGSKDYMITSSVSVQGFTIRDVLPNSTQDLIKQVAPSLSPMHRGRSKLLKAFRSEAYKTKWSNIYEGRNLGNIDFRS